MSRVNLQLLLVVISVNLLLLESCRSFKSVHFSNQLKKDTVSFSGELNMDSRIAGVRVLGPYTLNISGSLSNVQQKKWNAVVNEDSDRIKFMICKDGTCANAEGAYYTKTKVTSLAVISPDDKVTRIKAEKIFGSVNYLGDTPGFEVNITKGGTGSLNLTLGLVTIRPINKKSSYGKLPYGVGLEFILDEKVIGSFIHQREFITIVLKDELSEKNKMILTAVAVCLMNKSNTIRIL